MKNIYFIEAKSPGAHIFSFTVLPRLGSILLATILKQRGYNTKVFIEDLAEPDWKELENADMVCISSITSTANRAFQLAEKYKKRGIPVALGGVHSTFLSEESLQYADFVVRGEGEETLLELVDVFDPDENPHKINEKLERIKGLSWRDRCCTCTYDNPGRKFIKDLNDAPIPDFSLVYRWQEKARVIPIATSRGCTFACKFCSVIPMFGGQLRFKSVDRVLEELEAAYAQIKTNKKIRHIFFIDDNFTANKKRVKKLLHAMISRDLTSPWSAQIRADAAKDDELLDLMKKAGCLAVYIGFESINPKTLSLYNKGQSVKDIENSIRKIKKRGINIHGMFVLGSDTDDIATIRNTTKFAKKLDIDSIQFMILTPLPGTPVFEDLKNSGRLIHTDWSKYDAHHTVFKPKLMSAYDLHVQTLKAMGKFYSWMGIFKNLWQFDLFYAFVGLYGKRSVKKALATSKNYAENLKILSKKNV